MISEVLLDLNDYDCRSSTLNNIQEVSSIVNVLANLHQKTMRKLYILSQLGILITQSLEGSLKINI